ncbi:alpha/beta hydrolase-fold protein [Hyphobacterium sp. HN65]|uniref:Alpha/beta hydrolase-fold protein n=1 Tax=Hyphobacterium lacteum TaxID=3116575 RepID=A0ABU7LR24_9PROT|nr:alpha/beta hydrolase-fold protein [Hyphobacterium sp. HN65]MEE2526353.1 alpha/beta hydrolase-fold protein [Hyphobacterium sp. HN65]
MQVPVLAALMALTVGTASGAQVTVNDSEILRPPVAANGIQYVLKVRVPEACREAACPIVYMLDAEYSFPLASVISEHLSQRGQLPDLVLVGIGYEDTSPVGYRMNRSRDYTPAFVPEGGYGPRFQANSGGAPDFLEAIENTIIPFIEGQIGTDSDARGLVGHSYGGLFASWVLQERPALFTNYLIVSPSLWYDDQRFLTSMQEAPPDSDAAQNVYLAVGEYEEQPENGRSMVTDLIAFGNAIEAWDNPNADYLVRVFENETHASIFPTALSSGLRALY